MSCWPREGETDMWLLNGSAGKAIPNMTIAYVRKTCTSRFAACVRDGERE